MIFVGHRGVGKSSLLKRVKQYSPSAQCWDLDQEVEKTCGKRVNEIFTQEGESYFREMEKKTLQRLMKTGAKPFYVAVGAGFEGTFPSELPVVWVRRRTDSGDRVFLNRPRLAKVGSEDSTDYNEYLRRFEKRNQRYREWAHFDLTLIEGLDFVNPWEAVLFNKDICNVTTQGQLTLQPENCRSIEHLKTFVKIYESLFTHFELRDDLLSREQIQWAMDLIPPQKLIYSYRKRNLFFDFSSLPHPMDEISLIDWPLEWGEPIDSCTILSLHQREEDIRSGFQRLERYKGRHLKLAIPVRDFEELWEAHQWWSEDPKNRSFLPCSGDGRWVWYRLRQKPHMTLNFVRLGGGPKGDQPLLLDWLRCLPKFENFAAILGNPVEFSHTPIEQDEYFRSRNRPVFKIKMEESELESLHVLRNLGLECAAVTSPLKMGVTHYCDQLSPAAKKVNSVNTLFLGKQSEGHNTDIEGLEDLLASVSSHTAVWGGGGVREALSFVLPKTTPFYSARSGKLLKGTEIEVKTLVWAVGRSRHKNWPPCRPERVIDLNYTEDSPGLEFAIKVGAEYISGQTMFKTQAIGQREFWSFKNSPFQEEKGDS